MLRVDEEWRIHARHVGTVGREALERDLDRSSDAKGPVQGREEIARVHLAETRVGAVHAHLDRSRRGLSDDGIEHERSVGVQVAAEVHLPL